MDDTSSRRSLVANAISADYQTQGSTVDVFKDVSLTVNQGEILGLFGPNGCGKSTLLRVLAMQKAATSGTIEHKGWDKPVRYSLVRQHYTQDFFNWLNLLNNIIISLPSPLQNHAEHAERIERLRKSLKIEVDLNLRPSQCSGGQLQQASILRAFAVKPDILIADEPFSALDFSVSQMIRNAFVQQVQENGIIAMVVLHRIEDIVEVCDRALAIPQRPFTSSEATDAYAKAECVVNQSDLRRGEMEEKSFIELLRYMLGHR